MNEDSNAAQSGLNEPVQVVLAQLETMARAGLEHLPQLFIAIVVLLVTWGVAALARKLVGRVLGRIHQRRSLVVLFQKLASIGIWTVGIIAAAVVVFPSITPGKMLTALGLGSVAIGFAFKDIFENFIAGMLVLLREPFALDDFIECDGIEGFVEEITIRDTRIRQTDGQPVVLPNAMLFTNPVTVRTDKDKRRVGIECGIAYSEDIDEARAIIEKAVQGVDSSRDGDPIQVFAKRFGASSVDFEIVWWTGSKPIDVRRSTDQVITAVKKALDEAGIEIPFPYRTLTFKEPLTLDGPAQREPVEKAA